MKKHPIPAGDFFYVPQNTDQELEDLRILLRMPGGRRLFRGLLSVCNAMDVTMHDSNARITEYREGMRAIGLWLAARIETAVPGDVARLMQESSNDRQAANAKTRRKADDQ
jgi:hypothetical protein